MMLDSPQHKIDACLKRDIEAGHPHVGDRETRGATVPLADEERNHTATRTHHIAVTYHGETHRAISLDIVGGGESFVAGKLRRSVEVYRSTRLVEWRAPPRGGRLSPERRLSRSALR